MASRTRQQGNCEFSEGANLFWTDAHIIGDVIMSWDRLDVMHLVSLKYTFCDVEHFLRKASTREVLCAFVRAARPAIVHCLSTVLHVPHYTVPHIIIA